MSRASLRENESLLCWPLSRTKNGSSLWKNSFFSHTAQRRTVNGQGCLQQGSATSVALMRLDLSEGIEFYNGLNPRKTRVRNRTQRAEIFRREVSH
ncbi:hypothetical protein EU77_00750 [Mesotoga sp. SC_NapDC]|nr:hypothetical protein EU77_00750 [Mesotoga sp. SC_NapDC]